VGPDEAGLTSKIMEICTHAKDRIRIIDYTITPESFMACADIFCLPSYREGFGMVIIEAAAARIPTIASRIYGITDAVVDGTTGLLHPPGDINAMVLLISDLLTNSERRIELGVKAQERAVNDFSQTAVTQGLLSFYEKINV
jgi:glycosyltransferase involved in cell wall biosynthesis